MQSKVIRLYPIVKLLCYNHNKFCLDALLAKPGFLHHKSHRFLVQSCQLMHLYQHL